MERDYLEWINNAYSTMVNNNTLSNLKLKLFDGYINVHRCGDFIRIDIVRVETIRMGGVKND